MHGRHRRRIDVVQKRLRHLPQPSLYGCQQPGLPQQPADDVAAVFQALQGATGNQLTNESMRSRHWYPRPASQLGQGQAAMSFVERREHRQQSRRGGRPWYRCVSSQLPQSFAEWKSDLHTMGGRRYCTDMTGQAEITAEIAAGGCA
jgi:hypothetical protein